MFRRDRYLLAEYPGRRFREALRRAHARLDQSGRPGYPAAIDARRMQHNPKDRS